MEKKILLFDIDRTLFDTDKWYLDHEKVLRKLFLKLFPKADDRELCSSYFAGLRCSSKNCNVDIITHIKDFGRNWDFDVDQLVNIIGREYEKCDYSAYVPSRITQMLDSLQKGFPLGIFSEGDEWFQNLKLRGGNIEKFFNKELIYIYKNKIKNINKLPGNSLVFDDSRRIISGVKEVRNDIIPVLTHFESMGIDFINKQINCGG